MSNPIMQSADLSDGYKLSWQEARGGAYVRAVVKDVSGQKVAQSETYVRLDAVKAKFEVTERYLAYIEEQRRAVEAAAMEEEEDEDFDDGEDDEEEYI